MDTSKLDRSEILGMVAAAVLVISLFLEWYSLSTDPSVVQRGNDPPNWACGVGNTELQRLEHVPGGQRAAPPRGGRPFILAWIVIRGHALSWPRGELTAIVGLTAFVLIAYNGLVDKPQAGLEMSLAFGYWLALLAVDRHLHIRWLPSRGERRRRAAQAARHLLASPRSL